MCAWNVDERVQEKENKIQDHHRKRKLLKSIRQKIIKEDFKS
jgi:hypothetical protein